MARKTKVIILGKLTESRAADVRAMLEDLKGSPACHVAHGDRPSPWSRRFAASGKTKAPKIRTQEY
jgi:hypothetical protein